MKRDIGVISGAVLTIGAFVWVFWGNPETSNRTGAIHRFESAPELKLLSEHSPYMRSER